jgi:glycogen debranching enzyme
MVSQCAETLVLGSHRHQLFAFDFSSPRGPLRHPTGEQYLDRFERGLSVDTDYRIGKYLLRKSIVGIHGSPTTLLRYELVEAPAAALLELRFFFPARDIHALTHENAAINQAAYFEKGVMQYTPYEGLPAVYVSVDQGRYIHAPEWWKNFWYREDAARGFEAVEDQFSPGVLHMALFPHHAVYLRISTTKPGPESLDTRAAESSGQAAKSGRRRTAIPSMELAWAREIMRREALSSTRPYAINPSRPAVREVTGGASAAKDSCVSPELLRVLRQAADQFIIRRGSQRTSVIAGYPWFTEWGRDAMISIPGICFVTGRYQDAASVLRLFKDHLCDGLLPNRFPDGSHEPEYNSVDASLWAFEVVWRYAREAEDASAVREEFLPMLRQTIAAFVRGTHYGIAADSSDGLLRAGSSHTQLTWMDAKVGGAPVTPRHGKPVEINALWINALLILARLEQEYGESGNADEVIALACRAHEHFSACFWDERRRYLVDCVSQDIEGNIYRDSSLRPNQLLALSLSFPTSSGQNVRAQSDAPRSLPLVSAEQARLILAIIRERLFVGIGLRTLDPSDPLFSPRYEGAPDERDRAYHQGTVWPWLLAPYLRAVARYGSNEEFAKDGQLIISALSAHLLEGGVGSVSEILDATPPHYPRGCPFQAWSVGAALECAELLGLT